MLIETLADRLLHNLHISSKRQKMTIAFFEEIQANSENVRKKSEKRRIFSFENTFENAFNPKVRFFAEYV